MPLRLVAGGKLDEDVNCIRPQWLNPFMHLLNSIFAAADIALSPNRSFSKQSFQLILCFCAAYAAALLATRLLSGAYPYPFMNEGSFVYGLILWLVIGSTMTVAALTVHALGT